MAKTDILKEIVNKKKSRLLLARQNLSEEMLKEKVVSLPKTRSFIEAISKPRQISLIAEIKKQSPSGGVLRADFDHMAIAKIYEDAQAQAVSVLTEEDYFAGNIFYINEVKSVFSGPVLRKDFIVEPYQVYESRFYGADAILLIEDLLPKDKLLELLELAKGLGLACLVEVHDEKGLKKILGLKAVDLIGINNRNLRTLDLDFKATEVLYPLIPKGKVVVVESGIKSAQDILFLKILGVNAVLVGQVFMQAQDIRKKIEELMGW